MGREPDYKRILMERRKAVLAEMGMKCDTLAAAGRVAEEDQAALSHDEFITSHLNGLGYTQLRFIDEALDRIETGDYGICLSCDGEIPPKRLNALPWARYCVPCQEAIDCHRQAEEQIAARGV